MFVPISDVFCTSEVLLMRPQGQPALGRNTTKSPTPTTFYYFIAAVKSYSLVSQCESISSQYQSESKHCDFFLNSTRSSMTDLQEKGGEIELNIEMTYWKTNTMNQVIQLSTIKVIISESQCSRTFIRWSRSKKYK